MNRIEVEIELEDDDRKEERRAHHLSMGVCKQITPRSKGKPKSYVSPEQGARVRQREMI